MVLYVFAFLLVVLVNVAASLCKLSGQIHLLLGRVLTVQGATGVLHELVVVVCTLLTQVTVLPEPVQELAGVLHLVADFVIVQRVGEVPDLSLTEFLISW